MSAGRTAALKLDWTKIGSSLGLKGQTASALSAFKKRNDDARRKVQALSELPSSVDFSHYRGILNNKSVIDEIESAVKNFKPASYDVSRQLRLIEAFEQQAVKNAEETKNVVDRELVDLEQTLTNIETARPIVDLTVDDVMTALPEVEKKTEQLVSRGKWDVPGYKEKFGDLSVL